MQLTKEADPPALDLESLVQGEPEGEKTALRFWLRMLSCTNLISGEIRRRLRAEFGVTLPQFDVLAQLARAPDGLRLGELSQRMMVTNSNMTGLVDRLVADGLVLRRVAAGDRRAITVTRTKKGKTFCGGMAVAHEAWLREMLSEMQPRAVAATMRTLATLKTVLQDNLKKA